MTLVGHLGAVVLVLKGFEIGFLFWKAYPIHEIKMTS